MAREIIKLYGDISTWSENSATRMVNRIAEAASVADGIDLHVHCYGGSVIEGNMIYNAIRKCPVPVDVYVDGVAASQAAIVILAASKIYMSENALQMHHGPYCYVCGRGTADDHTKTARILREMEKTAIKAAMTRTGKPETEVKAWFTGADMWFSAEQALEAGLIDGIVDPIAGQMEKLKPEDLENYTEESVYALFCAHLLPDEVGPKTTTNINNMDKKALIEKFGLSGVTVESPDEQVMAAIQAKLDQATADAQAAQAALQKEQSAQITATLEAVKDKITPEQRVQFQAIGEKLGMEALQAVVNPLKTVKPLSAMIHGGEKSRENRNDWTFKDWAEKEPAKLEAMAQEDPEAFNALYKAHFGKPAPEQK